MDTKKTSMKAILGGLFFLLCLLSPYSIIQQKNTTISTPKASCHIGTASFCDSAVSETPVSSIRVQKTISFAADEKTSTQEELASSLNAFLKVMYVLLWPVLRIAGLAMDNSLVYGEVFGLDNALWKFRGIMKNFANFALGFLFLRSIISYVVNPTEKKNPKDMIAKLLIGGIGVQLSRFIVGALVDLSTVLTIGIGGLPLQLMDTDTNAGNKLIFALKTDIKLNDKATTDNLVALYTLPGSSLEKYILPCKIDNGKLDFSDTWANAFGIDSIQTTTDATNAGNNTQQATQNTAIKGTNNITKEQVDRNYCMAGTNIISADIYKDGYAQTLFGNGDAANKELVTKSLDAFNTDFCANKTCQTMQTFAKHTEGYQGAFYSLYASLLGLGTIHIGVPKSTAAITTEAIIKTVIGLAYLIPLAILAIVLIMRVGYLWLVIAFSPFIVLASIKGIGIKSLEGGLKIGGMKTGFNLSTVMSLLLLPVIVTFAVSLSIVFLSAMSEGLSTNGTAKTLNVYTTTEGTYKCYDIAITNICIDTPRQDIGTGILDYFSWTILNIFGIALMRFVVMAALKSSEFTKGIAESTQNLAQSMMTNANIIPIPGGNGGFTNFGALGNQVQELTRNIDSGQRAQTESLSQIFTGMAKDAAGYDKEGNKVFEEQQKTIKDSSSAGKALVTAASHEAFKDKTMLDFQQFDNANAFANSLAAHGWDSTKGPAPVFGKGQEIFSTGPGQQLLATLLDNQTESNEKGEKIRVDTEKLRPLFSGKTDAQTEALWEKYKAEINKKRDSTAEATIASDETTPSMPQNTGGSSGGNTNTTENTGQPTNTNTGQNTGQNQTQ